MAKSQTFPWIGDRSKSALRLPAQIAAERVAEAHKLILWQSWPITSATQIHFQINFSFGHFCARRFAVRLFPVHSSGGSNIYERPKWTCHTFLGKRLNRSVRFLHQNMCMVVIRVVYGLDFAFSPRVSCPSWKSSKKVVAKKCCHLAAEFWLCRYPQDIPTFRTKPDLKTPNP